MLAMMPVEWLLSVVHSVSAFAASVRQRRMKSIIADHKGHRGGV
jgi:hypothetical protein